MMHGCALELETLIVVSTCSGGLWRLGVFGVAHMCLVWDTGADRTHGPGLRHETRGHNAVVGMLPPMGELCRSLCVSLRHGYRTAFLSQSEPLDGLKQHPSGAKPYHCVGHAANARVRTIIGAPYCKFKGISQVTTHVSWQGTGRDRRIAPSQRHHGATPFVVASLLGRPTSH